MKIKMNMFKRIFHGSFRPADTMKYSSSYIRFMHENYNVHQEFRNMLQGEEKEVFDQLEEMDIELSALAQEENYIAGMKAGIRLMLEAIG